MADELIVGILLDIQKQQLATAGSIGRIEQKLDDVVKVKEQLEKDVEELKKAKWKQAGALGVLAAFGELLWHYVSKKLFP